MRLLVSVRNEDEAAIALRGGCDVLDVKEPLRGSLGAADPGIVQRVVEAANGKVPVSAAWGELADLIEAEDCDNQIEGLTYCKAGPARLRRLSGWRESWQRFLKPRNSPSAKWVGVIYADGAQMDSPPSEDLFDCFCEARCPGLLIDTGDKKGGNLLERMSMEELRRWRRVTREAGMFLALAGSLRWKDLAGVEKVEPDLVAVRGGVCRGGDRTGSVDEELVREWKERLRACNPRSSAGLAVR